MLHKTPKSLGDLLQWSFHGFFRCFKSQRAPDVPDKLGPCRSPAIDFRRIFVESFDFFPHSITLLSAGKLHPFSHTLILTLIRTCRRLLTVQLEIQNLGSVRPPYLEPITMRMSGTSVFWLQPRELSVHTLVFSVCLLYWSQIRLPRFQFYLEIEVSEEIYTFNQSTWKADKYRRSLWVQDQPDLYSESQVNQGYSVRAGGGVEGVVFKFAVFTLSSVKIPCGVIRSAFSGVGGWP